MFDEVYEFGAGETLTQRYRLVIANGGWDAAQVEAVAGGWRGGGYSQSHILPRTAFFVGMGETPLFPLAKTLKDVVTSNGSTVAQGYLNSYANAR